ncbi:[NiFe]-hydrogenase assembly chaperone HybE [Sinirhodobacter sp. WL0062]|uniref:[NiFe]-hydrogenase assembly chaperone HybE n=1 Tax=Rhodobacter flavimaris TaxID=2907145 RepID=A0ABS8YRP2_9RHOB|nr:[NiFe]-hydrogenase assembly chaperone HybE [Sinirhodobacter sp. WL0062]MCE5972358.1 [NiFe]-hydrogenase assembly chaperone HybE [Sinirhodobacter sp. WL0062]
MSFAGFEGSYMGANDRISEQAIMECKICWTPYDPAEGDEFRQILPGTSFAALPDDWKCPNCDAPKEQFMVREDPGAPALIEARRIDEITARLVADFREVWHSKMRDVPLVNKALSVEAVGFVSHEGRPLGVLLSPWFMNLILLPREDEDWSGLLSGAKEIIDFPSGSYEFIHNTREMVGGYKACSLFSPMGDFQTQMQATDVARAVMHELFKDENRAETDRRAEIRATREADLAAAEMPEDEASEQALPTRRKLISAGLADETNKEEMAEE